MAMNKESSEPETERASEELMVKLVPGRRMRAEDGGEDFTALAFPPTCMHLSWNQFQLESNSVDLWARAACHPPADTSPADSHLPFGRCPETLLSHPPISSTTSPCP